MLLAVVLRLIGQDRHNVVVGGHCEVDRIILPPNGESSAAPDGAQVLAAVEAAERVESCNGEAVLLPFGLEDIEDGRAAALAAVPAWWHPQTTPLFVSISRPLRHSSFQRGNPTLRKRGRRHRTFLFCHR